METPSVRTAEPKSKRATGQPRASKRPPDPGADSFSRVSDILPNPQNPRKITDEQLDALRNAMGEFGDLSGLVVNLTTGNMVGGHQRVKILGDAPITIQHRYDKPTKQGTVAEGHVVYGGEKFVYRAVRWNKVKEQAAMLAANKHGGTFDDELVKSLLAELSASGQIDVALTGFDKGELETMFGPTDEEKERGALLAVLNVSIAEPNDPRRVRANLAGGRPRRLLPRRPDRMARLGAGIERRVRHFSAIRRAACASDRERQVAAAGDCESRSVYLWVDTR